ncbi:hypothetical protein Ciccas_000325 [Cichlidogyrus casuarinus]|uniref:Uncharacterized protein n=1 Tax=Cichlidogyrus casuarinus TaxID=1844966 RepID=A0ABD2QNA8_9PLAT
MLGSCSRKQLQHVPEELHNTTEIILNYTMKQLISSLVRSSDFIESVKNASHSQERDPHFDIEGSSVLTIVDDPLPKWPQIDPAAEEARQLKSLFPNNVETADIGLNLNSGQKLCTQCSVRSYHSHSVGTVHAGLQTEQRASFAHNAVDPSRWQLSVKGCNPTTGQSCRTLFAPVNQPSGISSSNPDYLDYYILKNVYKDLNSWVSTGDDMTHVESWSTSAYKMTPNFYFFAKHNPTNQYFINQRKVEPEEKVASNGKFFALNAPLAMNIRVDNLRKILKDLPNVSKTLALLDKLTEQDTAFVHTDTYLEDFGTIFIVTDSGWNKLPASVYNELAADVEAMKKFFSNHFAKKQILFHEWSQFVPSIAFSVGRATNTPTSARIQQIGSQGEE